MARMLQALKNLEARSVRPAERKVPAEKAEGPVHQPQPESSSQPVLVERPAVAVLEPIMPETMQVVDKLDAVVANELAGMNSSEGLSFLTDTPDNAFTDFAFFGQKVGWDTALDAPAQSELPVQTAGTARPPVESEETLRSATEYRALGSGKHSIAPEATLPAVPVAQAASVVVQPIETAKEFRKTVLRVPVQEPCAFERQVRRTLSDPTQAQPILELVDRLERDLEQSGSKLVTFVTLGGEKAWFTSLLHVATISAERLVSVLLIDGDSARCRLSIGMEQGHARGLCEVVGGTATSKACIVKTATGGLSFLPAGQLRHYDFSTAGGGLESSLAELSEEFDRLLIDAGRSGEPGVAALARQADATYLVIELGAVETSTAQAALADLRAAGARVLGCIAI